jgi:hypothetical protein
MQPIFVESNAKRGNGMVSKESGEKKGSRKRGSDVGCVVSSG